MIESDGLVIQNVNRDNAGTYTCRARVPDTGELEERDIQLDVSIQCWDIFTLAEQEFQIQESCSREISS